MIPVNQKTFYMFLTEQNFPVVIYPFSDNQIEGNFRFNNKFSTQAKTVHQDLLLISSIAAIRSSIFRFGDKFSIFFNASINHFKFCSGVL